MNIGDVIREVDGLDALPVGTVGVVHTPGFEAKPVTYWKTGEREWNAIFVSTLLPLTVVYLPGRLPRPERVVKAEALREAASTWQVNGWADDMPKGSSRPALILGMAQRACDFLRTRADRIEAGDAL